jgi:hypothetical protein
VIRSEDRRRVWALRSSAAPPKDPAPIGDAALDALEQATREPQFAVRFSTLVGSDAQALESRILAQRTRLLQDMLGPMAFPG